MSEVQGNILFLEDDEFTRNIVTAQLEKAGLSVQAIKDKEALLTSNYGAFDLLLTDLNVNGQNMQEVITQVKGTTDIPVVVLSQADLPAGPADLHLKKPLNKEKIAKILILIDGEKLDISRINAFAGGDVELQKSYIVSFIANYEKELQLLNKEIRQSDGELIKARAHKMLSSVAYYNRKNINNLLKQLESGAEFLKHTERMALLDRVQTSSNKLIRQLKQMV